VSISTEQYTLEFRDEAIQERRAKPYLWAPTPKVDLGKLSCRIAHSNVTCELCPTRDRKYFPALVTLIEREPLEWVMLSAKLYSRRLTRGLYSCCICAVIHAAV